MNEDELWGPGGAESAGLGVPLEARDKPVEAVVYFRNGSSYTAQVWQYRTTELGKQVIRYSYWILITDENFKGREIHDSLEDAMYLIDVIFKYKNILDIKGFFFRHFAGNAFRVRFDLDSNNFNVKTQYLEL